MWVKDVDPQLGPTQPTATKVNIRDLLSQGGTEGCAFQTTISHDSIDDEAKNGNDKPNSPLVNFYVHLTRGRASLNATDLARPTYRR